MGTPGGRPKQDPKIRELACVHGEEAVLTLVAMMTNKRSPPSTRVAAANAILDRAYGKPSSSLELTGKEGEALIPDRYEGWTEPAKRLDRARRIAFILKSGQRALTEIDDENGEQSPNLRPESAKFVIEADSTNSKSSV